MPPTCGKVKCGKPPDMNDGNFLDIIYEFNDIVQYKCNLGFVLDSGELTCSENRTYVGKIPTCSRISCAIPEEIEMDSQSSTELSSKTS